MANRAIVMLVSIAIGVGCATAQIPAAEPGVRTLAFRPGRTIRDLLLPSDKVVTLVYNADVLVEDTPPTPKEALRRLLSEDPSYAIATVVLTRFSTSLNDAGTWVETRLQATVQEVLRPVASDGAPIRSGDVVDVRASGGETVIDGVVVRTDDRAEFRLNQKYLLSLGKRDTEGHWNNVFGLAMEIDHNERLSSVRLIPSPLAGLSLGDLRKVIRDRH